jgi:hypothetical protein
MVADGGRFRKPIFRQITGSEAAPSAGCRRRVGPRRFDRNRRIYESLRPAIPPASRDISGRSPESRIARATAAKTRESATFLLIVARIVLVKAPFAAILGGSRVRTPATRRRLVAELTIAPRSRRCTYTLPCRSRAVARVSAGGLPSRMRTGRSLAFPVRTADFGMGSKCRRCLVTNRNARARMKARAPLGRLGGDRGAYCSLSANFGAQTCHLWLNWPSTCATRAS